MLSELKKLRYLIARNIKLYFKDKLTFFVSLITPLILLFLFFTFLRGVIEDSLLQALQGLEISNKSLKAFSGGWLFSSILSTSCITVSFCSGMIVYDKLNNVKNDFQVTPIKPITLQISYVLSNFITTLLVCLILFAISIIYFAIAGWYLTFVDILLILINVILTTLFGCMLANTIWYFVKSQGGLSGISALISSMYGFIVGAYMPLASMGTAIINFASFLPGTYSTIIFRNYYMNGTLNEICKDLPESVLSELKQSFDCKFSFFGTNVNYSTMFLIVTLSTLAILGIFSIITIKKIKHKTPIKNTK